MATDEKKEEVSESTKYVKSTAGDCFYVDISDEACGEFGFKHGDKIIDTALNQEGVVMGMAPSAYDRRSLWYTLDVFGGKVRCKTLLTAKTLVKISG